ncbi:hypothetical protein [Pseudofrankia saprophytica]|uniref:hypothetical protein n=1 Tax=Pseudofrankia saprophytica TaxID=298655 RepID=UPI00030827B0|nr:hypothetical protein [Pseudofrankia saprophytica]
MTVAAESVGAGSAPPSIDLVDLPLGAVRTTAASPSAAPAAAGGGPTTESAAGEGPAAAPAAGTGPTAGPTTAPTVAGGGPTAAPSAQAGPSTPTADDGDGPTATPLRGEYAAYVTAVDPVKATVTFDVVEWFTGTAAQQACTEDGDPGPWPAERCNDYYLRNSNAVPRTLPVAPKAQLKYVDENGPADGVSLDDPAGGDVPTTLSALAAKLGQFGPDGRLKCFIKVESGALTTIAEIYTP